MKLFIVNIKENSLQEIIKYGSYKLNFTEQLDVQKFRFDKGKAVKTISLLLRKYVIGNEFGLNEYFLKMNKYGKPYIKDYNENHFNISHSGDWVICGISEFELGVDVEEKKEFRDIIEIAKRFFSKQEYLYLQELNDVNRQTAVFYDIWTKKESFIKAVGQGISLNLGSFSVPINLTISDNFVYNVTKWHFMSADLGNNYPVSVCEKDFSSKKIEIVKVDLNSL